MAYVHGPAPINAAADLPKPIDCSGYVHDVFVDYDLVKDERDEAVYVALWLYREHGETPQWRWMRRRYLNRRFEEQVAYADRLGAELKAAARRGAIADDGTLS